MESNVPVIAKKVWNLVRVAYFLIRKGISKSKVNMLDLNLMMKRGKIAGKAISNLMFQHHYAQHHQQNVAHQLPFDVAPDDYEFSCSNTPSYHYFGKRRRNNQNNNSFFACAHAPQTLDDDLPTLNALKAVVDILNNNNNNNNNNPPFSPPIPVRQLRITDSPFPLQDPNADPLVDKAADEFISRFYKELSLQKTPHHN
ncbi:hypothetical protein IC575_003119 [Cucumis melo]|nr:uncharacterized protein LOC103500787 [Cucumis melo]